MPSVTGVCEYCGKTFKKYHRPDSKRPRFCSQQCWLKVHNNPERNKEVSVQTAEKRANSLRGRGEGKNYTKYHGKHLHRIVAEKMLERPLKKEEIVHHIDGNKFNNKPSNLQIITRAEHIELHRRDMEIARGIAKRGGFL